MLLQSRDHGELLDNIDCLRSQGISRYVDLPQIVVCGEQSSGKSSVLEAVSHIKFPRKDNLCTRFATEVILRRDATRDAKISIVPSAVRNEQDRLRLSSFQRNNVQLDHLATLIDDATEAMGINTETRAFSNDVLRLEVSGPEQPHLTLVDLPGLFQAGNKTQSESDVEAVNSLVLSYMKKRRSIILAVITAKNEFVNQVVTRYARQVDSEGLRTLGVITKPDTLHDGSDSERSFVELAENKDVKLRLGWHVLKNRDYDTRHATTDERDTAEADFFAKGAWASLPNDQVGIASLRSRLSILLRDQILQEVPKLLHEVQKGLTESRSALKKLGTSRATLQDQRRYLLDISHTFSSLISSAVGGFYNDPFFSSPSTTLGYEKRLRAVVQNLLLDFARDMRKHGHRNHIVDGPVSHTEARPDLGNISTVDFQDKVLHLMRRSRGCELPGTYNPHIIQDLFQGQSEPWSSQVDDCSRQIWNAVVQTLEIVLHYAADDVTAFALRQHVINPAMNEIERKLKERVASVLKPYRERHPITYNHRLTEDIQMLRANRQKDELAKQLDSFFGTNHAKGQTYVKEKSFDVKSLRTALTTDTTTDMERVACSDAIDCMRAYYKVAIKTLIDNFGALVQEEFLQELREILSPQVAISLDDATVSNIAAETPEAQRQRSRETEKLRVLEKACCVLQSLQSYYKIDHTASEEETIDHQASEAGGSGSQDCEDERGAQKGQKAADVQAPSVMKSPDAGNQEKIFNFDFSNLESK